MKNVSIVGAGLAGCEAALQLSSYGFNVTLYDSKPEKMLDAYYLPTFAELVCNNSFGSISEKTPLGTLLKELSLFNSRLLSIAQKCALKDSTFFSVDKKKFSQTVTMELENNKVTIINKHMTKVPDTDIVIIATGPLTDNKLICDLSNRFGIKKYNFADASSPVIDITTVNLRDKHINKLSNDLYSVTIPENIFDDFYKKLVSLHNDVFFSNVDKSISFEQCQTIEKLAECGKEFLKKKRFNYDNSKSPILLIRRENALENGFILSGCTTTLRHKSQVSVFSLLPGLEKCKFIKYGRVHRNTFFNSPEILNEFYQIKGSDTYIIGQLSGIDGYAAAISSGLVSSMHIIFEEKLPPIPTNTIIGGLAKYVSNVDVTDFQPMCASFSLLDDLIVDDKDYLETYLAKYRL